MYKMLFAAMLLSSSVAFAESPPAAGGGATEPAVTQQNFQEKKAKISAHMTERIAEMQKRKACVDSASTPEALKACMPDRGKFGKRDGKQWGDGEGRRKFGKHRQFGGGEEGAPASAPAGE